MNKYTKISIKDCPTFFFISDGKNIIYFEQEKGYSNYKINTVHQGNIHVGTGFRITEDGELNAETVNKHLPIILPNWAHESDFKHVKKWPTLQSFIDRERQFHRDRVIVEEITLN